MGGIHTGGYATGEVRGGYSIGGYRMGDRQTVANKARNLRAFLDVRCSIAQVL